MPHLFNFIDLSERLFLLRNLAAGSREYCKIEHVVKTGDSYGFGEDAWTDYSVRLRSLISDYLIECATKTRIFQDTIQGKARPHLIKEADEWARSGCNIGKVIEGNFQLTVRESCNKIIHATNVELSWANSRVNRPYRKFSYWTGKCQLRGHQGSKSWHVELDINNWCVALDDYLESLFAEVDWEDYSG